MHIDLHRPLGIEVQNGTALGWGMEAGSYDLCVQVARLQVAVRDRHPGSYMCRVMRMRRTCRERDAREALECRLYGAYMVEGEKGSMHCKW